jgi:predicted RNA-binding protein (TIGR00451 family)
LSKDKEGILDLQNHNDAMLRIRKTADYQFGKGVGKVLFPDSARITFSKQTYRIRHVFLDGNLLATLRPTDGMFSLTIHGAKCLASIKPLRYYVTVSDDVVSFISRGKSVFAKHIVNVDSEIRPGEEVVVLDEKGTVAAVGRAVLSGKEMRAFKRGVAVRVRKGIGEEEGES